MSRIGKKPIIIPEGTKVEVNGSMVTANGRRGTLSKTFHSSMQIEVSDNKILVKNPFNTKFHSSIHGLTRNLIANMLIGVANGFSRTLVIEGLGYKAEVSQRKLTMQLGFSHPVIVEIPQEINISIEKNTILKVGGVDKELVGQISAKIRSCRLPEPYKGKGIRYIDEKIKRKIGKAAVTGTGK